MIPMQSPNMRLRHATRDDAAHVHRVVDTISQPFGSRVELSAGEMVLR